MHIERAKAIYDMYNGNFRSSIESLYFWQYVDEITGRSPLVSELPTIRTEYAKKIRWDYESIPAKFLNMFKEETK